MTNITKAAQDALRGLADWHWSQATTLRKAASTTAIDKTEPCKSSLLRMADWHEAQKLLLAALQDKAVEVADFQSRCMFVARMENMQANGDTWLTIPAVLALLNDCDMLASTELSAPPAPVVPATAAPSSWGYAGVHVWIGNENTMLNMTEQEIQRGADISKVAAMACAMLSASQQKGKQ